MKAAIFEAAGRIVHVDKPVPEVGPLDASIRIKTTTTCSTDVLILKGEYPVVCGLTVGHEPVGVIARSGAAVQGCREVQRVIAGAITPSGWRNAGLRGVCSQDGAGTEHSWKSMGGWKLGNTIDGCQAECVLVSDAMVNLAPVPDALGDEQVPMCPGSMSTGFSGAGTAGVRIGHAVAEVLRLTGGRGVDVAIEALGVQQTFEAALRVLRPGGTQSSLGVYPTDLTMPMGASSAGLGDQRTVTTLCTGGKERMRHLMSVIAAGSADLAAMVTHRMVLAGIEAACDLFGHQGDGVLEPAITP